MSTNEWRKKAYSIIWYDLIPRFSNVKSFYGKAEVEQLQIQLEHDHLIIYNLYSYHKNVARIVVVNTTINPINFGKYSATTTRHQKEFFKQWGLEDNEIKILMKQSLTDEEIDRL